MPLGFGDRFISSRRLYGTVRYLRQAAAIERLKNPSRGGQNLSERHCRLERSLRGKEALSKEIDDLSPSLSHIEAPSTVQSFGKMTDTFRGFLVPKDPRPPEADECCMSGCAVCVYDLYEESLRAYRESVDALRTSLSSLNVPQAEWPKSLRSPEDESLEKKDVVMSVFQEMERALKEKQRNQITVVC